VTLTLLTEVPWMAVHRVNEKGVLTISQSWFCDDAYHLRYRDRKDAFGDDRHDRNPLTHLLSIFLSFSTYEPTSGKILEIWLDPVFECS
jgi:hypothetical protein